MVKLSFVSTIENLRKYGNAMGAMVAVELPSSDFVGVRIDDECDGWTRARVILVHYSLLRPSTFY
jgi:hypothetical protein